MAKLLKEEVVFVEKLSEEIFKMTVKSEYVAFNARPGQFVNIRCCNGINALLRRPLSICRVDRIKSTFDVAFQIKGTGTGLLSEKKPGDIIDIIGPLGNPFDISESFRKIAVVGGGIGIFPLLFLLESKNDAYRTAFLGFRNKDMAVLTDEFRASSEKLLLTSDDGSIGNKGFVTSVFESLFDMETDRNGSYDIVYACGPAPMLKKVTEISAARGIRCEVSLEQRMGCGIGACLVCTCKIKLKDDWEYKFVCRDGPVFQGDEVIFD